MDSKFWVFLLISLIVLAAPVFALDSNNSYGSFTCPEYVMPLCVQGKVLIVNVDDYGCKKPMCVEMSNTYVTSVADFYLGANWVCSNGEVFKQKLDKCMPYAYWEETARKTCAQFTTDKCVSGEDANATGSNLIDTKCVGSNPAYVSNFQSEEACKANCTISVDDQGCKNILCENGQSERYCADKCEQQSFEEISNLKEKCYVAEGQLIVKINAQGCTRYFCNKPIDSNMSDSNVLESYSALTCTLLDELPQEKYTNCEANGGKLLVKTNQDNCITVLECVGAKINTNLDSNKINKTIIKDSVQLLGIAIKLEELKVELNKTSIKVQAISDYYKEIGDLNSSIKFQNAVDLLKTASIEIDALKTMIKERADNFTEVDVLEVKNSVQSIRKEILNKVLMILLD